jgi:hypothetical protein
MRIFSLVILAFVLSGCDGYYRLTGIVYEYQPELIKAAVDSVHIEVYVNKSWLRGSTYSDSSGAFQVSALTTPLKASYYFIFNKQGFRTDTVIKEGVRGKNEFNIEHRMFRQPE